MKTLMILAAIATVSAATPAAAADPRSAIREVVTLKATVSYSDLDLSRTAGADALIVRLSKVATAVCGDRPNAADTVAYGRYRACKIRTMDAAIREVNAPLVTARYARDAARIEIVTK